MTERPNILCLVSEDCPTRLGPYGDPVARTPNLDRLATEGIVFDAACCTAPVCAPSRFAIVTGRHAESCGPAQHMTAPSTHWPRELLTYPEVMRAAGYYCTNNSKTHYNCDIDADAIWDETSEAAHWRKRPAGKPFLAVFNPMITHESCTFPAVGGAVTKADVTLPAYLPDTEGMRETLARYYNRIEEMDRFMGERLAELEADGLADDTIVFYFSDHGSPLPRSKRFCYDEGLRIPMIVRVPAKWRHLAPAGPGERVAAPVSHVDLFPTFAALAGAAAPDGLHGQPFLGETRQPRTYAFSARDRMDEHYDMTRTARGARFRHIRNYAPHRPWGQHYAFAWVSPSYQDYERLHLAAELDPVQDRFWHRKPAEELYDMAADPEATRDLAGDPAFADILAEMRAALDAHILAVNDNGFIPEGAAPQGWHESRAPGAYPLRAIMDLAARAIRRDPADAPGLAAALSEPDLVGRYWAAQGLLMLSVEGHPLPEEARAAFGTEADPHVRIPLAEALGHAGNPEEPIRFLTGLVAGAGDPRLRLQALEALIALPPRPDLSLAVVTAAAEDGEEYVRGAAGYLKLLLQGTYRWDAPIFRFDIPLAHGHSGVRVVPRQGFVASPSPA